MRYNVLLCKFCFKEFSNDYPDFQDNVVLNCPHCGHGGRVLQRIKHGGKSFLPYWDLSWENGRRGYGGLRWRPPYRKGSSKHLAYVYRIWRKIVLSEYDVVMEKYGVVDKQKRVERVNKIRCSFDKYKKEMKI